MRKFIQPVALCPNCAKPMRAIRHVPQMINFPPLTQYQCEMCGEVLILEHTLQEET